MPAVHVAARVSPNGVHAVTASADKTAKVWTLADGECVRTLMPLSCRADR